VNLFYEVLQPDGPTKYYSAYDVLGFGGADGAGGLMWAANRVWKEDDNGQVKLVKSRFAAHPVDQTPIDKKEFFLIKLKSKSI
jgi:hypothetical protein